MPALRPPISSRRTAARFAVCAGSLLLLLITFPAASQGFDPVVFMATVRIQQDWTPGSVAAPDGTRRFFRDSLYNYEHVVGFTLVTSDTASSGWSVALDYDADRYGSLKLSRVRGVKHIAAADTAAELSALLHRIEVVLEKRILDRRRISASHFEWTWTPRAGYSLGLRHVTDTHGATLLIFDLRHI